MFLMVESNKKMSLFYRKKFLHGLTGDATKNKKLTNKKIKLFSITKDKFNVNTQQ
jgi:hypothetical protein